MFSGSGGNAVWVECGGAAVLIDCGKSAKAVERALSENGLSSDKLEAVFITHEHRDHISGLKLFLSRHPVPVYCSAGTKAALVNNGILSDRRIVSFEHDTAAGDFYVTRFNTPHDCEGSSGYRVTMPDGRTVAVCTDLGTVTDEVRRNLEGCAAVMIESNHDISMLYSGSYPAALKRRIAGDTGHLSNGECASELPSLVEKGTQRLILAHLSRANNRPDLARSTACAALLEHGMREDEDYILYVAPEKSGRFIAL